MRVNFRVVRAAVNGNKTVQTIDNAFFLGRNDRLLPSHKKNLPELGLRKEDCIAMSRLESVHFISALSGYNTRLEALIEGRSPFTSNFKAMSNFLQKPISRTEL